MFIALTLKKALSDSGTAMPSWIDLVMMYEWNLELAKVLQELDLDENHLDSFKTFCEQNRYNFDIR